VPRPDSREARDYARVDLFYDQSTLLPVGINVVQTSGDTKTVRLSDPARNPILSPADEAALHINDPDPAQWEIDILPWKER
jgi:hypothetical protein